MNTSPRTHGHSLRAWTGLVLFLLVFSLAMPSVVAAQTQTAIAGVARDMTGAVLPVSVDEKTVTVRGDSPIVDVVRSTRQEVRTREQLDALPTGRDFTTVGNALPSVNMGRFDVGGSSTNQQGTLTAFGSRGEDLNVQIDGMNGANSGWGEGWFTIIYHNEADYQEMAYS